jgi:hypothetical protein
VITCRGLNEMLKLSLAFLNEYSAASIRIYCGGDSRTVQSILSDRKPAEWSKVQGNDESGNIIQLILLPTCALDSIQLTNACLLVVMRDLQLKILKRS